jgi:photosystem II stability/assembly factor-like uncharacterized protein
VRIVGLGGTSLLSKDGGQHFEALTRPDRAGMTAISRSTAEEVVFTASGILIRESLSQ